MATTPTNIARSPATQEFDEKLAKLYDGILTEINKHLKRSMLDFKLNVDKILVPSMDEQEDARIAKKFTRKRLKILDSIDALVRTMTAGRNRVSLFDMFDQKSAMDQQYVSKYRKIKRMALNRLETGVSLIKFNDQQEIPLATILFPTKNTKLYTARYELLKQMLLTRVHKGIKNMTFVAPSKHKSFRLTKVEKTQMEVPIGEFLIPTPNTNFFTSRYNLSKHILLNKVNKGIKNLRFVSVEAKTIDTMIGAKRTKYVPLTSQMDVPIDRFLIPSGNTWYYAAKYELAKLKLLRKIKKGINSVEFTGGPVNIMERFFPDQEGKTDQANTIVGKAVARILKKESNARISASKRTNKVSEYAQFKRDRRADYWIHLDEKRNEMMANAWFGAGKRSRVINTKMNKKSGVFETKGSAFSGLSDMVGDALVVWGPKIGKAIGPGLGVAAAGALGFSLGRVLDEKLGISNAIGNAAGAVTTALGNRKYVKDVVNPGLEKNAWVKKYYRDLSGGEEQSAKEKAKLYDQALDKAKRRIEKRRKELDAAGIEYSREDLMSLKPIDYLVKKANGVPIELSPPMPLPAGAADYFMQGSSSGSMPQMNVLIEQNKELINLQKKNNGITIYNPHPTADFIFQPLDPTTIMK